MCSIRLVHLKIINSVSNFNKIIFSALQCRLECESGYVAQRTPLITCVNGEYAKGCHYLQKISQTFTHLTMHSASPYMYKCDRCTRLLETEASLT